MSDHLRQQQQIQQQHQQQQKQAQSNPWTYKGRLDTGQSFYVRVAPGSERDVIQGDQRWSMAEGTIAFTQGAPAWVTQTQGVVTEKLPHGERLSTNSPELAQAILGTTAGTSHSTGEQIDFGSFFRKKTETPSMSLIALALVIVGVSIWAWKNRDRGSQSIA